MYQNSKILLHRVITSIEVPSNDGRHGLFVESPRDIDDAIQFEVHSSDWAHFRLMLEKNNDLMELD